MVYITLRIHSMQHPPILYFELIIYIIHVLNFYGSLSFEPYRVNKALILELKITNWSKSFEMFPKERCQSALRKVY